MLRSILYFILLLPNISLAGLCDQNLHGFPTLNQGRVKPYIVMANESIKLMTGKSKYKNINADKLFCMLTLESIGIDSEIDLPILIEHVDVKKLIEIKDDQTFIPAKQALGIKDLVRSEIAREKQTTSYKKALNKLWFKIDTYEKITSGEFWKVVDIMQTQPKIEWIGVKEAFKDRNAKQMFEHLNYGEKKYLEVTKDTSFQTELTLVRSNIFLWAMLTALLGIFLTVLIKKPIIGNIFAWLTIVLEVAGMTLRVIVSGRAPITNMYETVLFSGFGALIIALIVFIFKKDKIWLLGGLGYNILCLFMMRFANGMLDSSISPLVPVLRDNFWLSTHVTTIILSYAALALSWLLANITLGKQRLAGISSKDYKYYEDLIYTAIKIGVVLLAAGIILGGVWADYSWGRFWGWDPKETWSLIVLLFYMAVLHGKSTSWINTHRFIILSAAGFMTVMMAWFGVNYILATGLHSYGFSEGGAIFLGTFFITQIAFIVITAKQKKIQA